MSPNIHEVLLHLLRNSGELTAELMRLTGASPLPDGKLSAEAATIDLQGLVPPKHHPNHVTLFRDQQNRAAFVAVVILLKEPDPIERYFWPVYVTAASIQHQCPSAILVITPSQAMAQWARAPIEHPHPTDS